MLRGGFKEVVKLSLELSLGRWMWVGLTKTAWVLEAGKTHTKHVQTLSVCSGIIVSYTPGYSHVVSSGCWRQYPVVSTWVSSEADLEMEISVWAVYWGMLSGSTLVEEKRMKSDQAEVETEVQCSQSESSANPMCRCATGTALQSCLRLEHWDQTFILPCW